MAASDDPRTDEDLLAAARLGDAAALEALILRYQPHVYRFGVKMCGDLEDARDVVQESMFAAARSVRGFRGDASVSTWLYSIARSFCLKKRRRPKSVLGPDASLDDPGARQLETLADPAPNPEEHAADREVARALSAAIGALDVPQREVLVLRDVEGLSAPEVAKVLGVSVQAVKSRLHRARLAVRRHVAPALGTTAASHAGPSCPDVLRRFSQHLEGELAADVCAEMEAHLEGCRTCRGACESLKQTLALCRATRPPDLPASLEASVRDAIREFLRTSA